MKILCDDQWLDVPLNYYPLDNEATVYVALMINLVSASDAYFQRTNSLRLVWNYLREIGLKSTLIKIFSRRREAQRNAKYLSVGLGHVEDRGELKPVVFVAPFHPACAEAICIDRKLIRALNPSIHFNFGNPVHRSAVNSIPKSLMALCGLHGWSSYSGAPLPTIEWDIVEQYVLGDQPSSEVQSGNAKALVKPLNTVSTPKILLPAIAKSVVESEQRLPATLLGYGNYAKTVLIPSLPPKIQITRIHEVDPLQLNPAVYERVICDSSPTIRDEDFNRIFFIAGFHHTHAALAIEALNRQSVAVVEKPLVTTQTQLDELLLAIHKSKGRFFACFNKRYLAFNNLVRSDLGIGNMDPINYHAIVYEVPLPDRHWYRWPNSGSRILSNGCHWVDHFLFLNNYCDVARYDLFQSPDGTANVTIVLQNQAVFTMVLTDIGSSRLGVQDYVELRQNGTTIRMINNSRYEVEKPDRILRKLKRNRMDCFQQMYRSIGESIIQGHSGDSYKSIEIGSRLMLGLEEMSSGLERKPA